MPDKADAVRPPTQSLNAPASARAEAIARPSPPLPPVMSTRGGQRNGQGGPQRRRSGGMPPKW